MLAQPTVFFSFNGQDRSAVDHVGEALREPLREEGLRVWLGEEELQPGTPWLPDLEQALKHSQAVVVFIGSSGIGRWQGPEIEGALIEQVRRGRPVIPVILPGAPDPDNLDLPLFLRRNTWVIFHGGLDDRDAIDRLLFGITGKNPQRRSEKQRKQVPTISETDPVDDAISSLSDSLKSGTVTYFVGSGATQDGLSFPPSSYEIARQLLTELKLIDPDHDRLLPPVDVASSYYAVTTGDTKLENRIVELITNRSKSIPKVHKKLCDLLIALSRRPVRRQRGGPSFPQLIVTTNLDVMMERALLTAGISFTRIVQHGSVPRINLNKYRGVSVLRDGYSLQLPSSSRSPRQVSRNDLDELDSLIQSHGADTIELGSAEDRNPLHSLAIQNLQAPILYKFCGSQDIKDSCVISTDQYFAFARQLFKQNLIPAQISNILSNTHILFLGYRFLDPDFRIACHVLLRQALEFRNYERYALQMPPDLEGDYVWRELAAKLWSKIKLERVKQTGIMTLEEREDSFLEKLLASV